jgi:hypothetical protein
MLYALRAISAKQARWFVEIQAYYAKPSRQAACPLKLVLHLIVRLADDVAQKPPRRFSGRSQVA